MSPIHNNPELAYAIHTDRLRRLHEQSRPRRDRARNDDRRWG